MLTILTVCMLWVFTLFILHKWQVRDRPCPKCRVGCLRVGSANGMYLYWICQHCKALFLKEDL